MLGRKTYTPAEFESGRNAISAEIAAFDALPVGAEKDALEPLFFNALVLVLDRFYVHRVRPVAGKDGTPLNEIELLVESLMNNGGLFAGNKVIRYSPETSVTGLGEGDSIRMTRDTFARLADAAFAELHAKFSETD